eukprot:gene4567-25158_t
MEAHFPDFPWRWNPSDAEARRIGQPKGPLTMNVNLTVAAMKGS